jgi:hypothetical protein
VDPPQVLRLHRRRRSDDQAVNTLVQQHLDGVHLRRGVLIGVDQDDVEAALFGGIRDPPGGQAEMRIFDVAHHYADGVRFPRVHAACKFVWPVVQLFRSGQNTFTHIVADGAVIAQCTGCLGLGYLGGFGDVGDGDVAPPEASVLISAFLVGLDARLWLALHFLSIGVSPVSIVGTETGLSKRHRPSIHHGGSRSSISRFSRLENSL